MKIGLLEFLPVIENEDMVPSTIRDFINEWNGSVPKESFLIASINPDYAGGVELCEHYNIDPKMGANCLVVEGKRNKNHSFAVCLVPVGYKYNMSSTIRKAMNARQVSVASLDTVIEISKMEYGSITPIGLPKEWTLYVDSKIMENERIIIGGGYKNCKISILTSTFKEMDNAVIMDNIAKESI